MEVKLKSAEEWANSLISYPDGMSPTEVVRLQANRARAIQANCLMWVAEQIIDGNEGRYELGRKLILEAERLESLK